MTQPPDAPQTYLISPADPEPEAFAAALGELLDGAEIACVRLDLATRDEARLTRLADAAREACHARDVAVVLREHASLAMRLGLDGVHWTGAPSEIRRLRADLGADAILGAACGTSRHDAMIAGELGADYVTFAPAGADPLSDARAERGLFGWWSEMIEVPVVAEGALTAEVIADLAPVVDWFAVGPEVWAAPEPLTALRALQAAMRPPR